MKLKEQMNEIREEEFQKAMEHYRPLVTAQYSAMLKMANKLNLYQHTMHLQLQVILDIFKFQSILIFFEDAPCKRYLTDFDGSRLFETSVKQIE